MCETEQMNKRSKGEREQCKFKNASRVLYKTPKYRCNKTEYVPTHTAANALLDIRDDVEIQIIHTCVPELKGKINEEIKEVRTTLDKLEPALNNSVVQ